MEDLPVPDFDSRELARPRSYAKRAVILIVSFVVILFLLYLLALSAPPDFPEGRIINIKEGSSLRAISLSLENERLIRSRVAFEVFVIIYGGERHIIPGDYFFEGSLPVFELARRIGKGESHLAPIKLTIPEGFNVEDIAAITALKLSHFNKDNFLNAAKPKEGYLFPDTYFFLTTDTEKEVLGEMSQNYEKKIAPLRPEIASSGKSEKQIIIMASIIEREAKGDGDRGIISGILWHRIKIGMALQVDAAPMTYRVKGLPESPIANPGLSSILAAIHPTLSPYLYYLHDKEGNVHYAKTFEEHKKNKVKYLQ